MSDKIRQIIRSQWPLRHSPNQLVREEARSLIRVHVELLRDPSCAKTRREGHPVQTAA